MHVEGTDRQLNPEQQAAAIYRGGPLLVLAGAGTGKTRVLVSRIVNLVAAGVMPWEILAVTFTNKAAQEMKARLAAQLGNRANAMWIGTFHSVCARLLRRYGEAVGLRRGFAIFDDDDQLKLVNRLVKDLGLDEKVSARSVLSRFDRAKNKGLLPRQTELVPGSLDHTAHRLFPLYEEQLRKENAVDFNDILLKAKQLFETESTRHELTTMFRHILVDEFQDTNRVQYDLVSHFAAATRNLTVVGDDDQAIYGWRGAEPRNLLDFSRDFPDAMIVRLEQNYRSTQVILDAANQLISYNHDRLGKSLWTNQGGGDRIAIRHLGDEREEAYFVAKSIRTLLDDGPWSPNDIAILYRTNAQSRVLEEHLRAFSIPAQVWGGLSFFERKEVKDVLAYVRLIANESADSSFERVVNVPTRGIGDTTIERLRQTALRTGTSMLAAARTISSQVGSDLGASPRKKLAAFAAMIDDLRAVGKQGASVAELLIQVVERTSIRARFEAEGSPESEDRSRNLAELVTMASDFDDETEGSEGVDGFLERIALSTPADNKEIGAAVKLMTIHIAKGLEFPAVFMTGLEDGLFPSLREREDVDDAVALEEERRLAYVAVTRAKQKLVLTMARTRRVWGDIRIQTPSRFLSQLPSECLEAPSVPRQITPQSARAETGPFGVRPARAMVRTRGVPAPHAYDEFDQRNDYDEDGATVDHGEMAADPFRPGCIVRHVAFGQGQVLSSVGRGRDRKVVVRFAIVGEKTVLARYVAGAENLETN